MEQPAHLIPPHAGTIKNLTAGEAGKRSFLMNVRSYASTAKGPAQMTLPSHSFCLEDRAYFFLVVVEEPVVV
ncbi:hypothetical protein V1282_007048 [Nitrobacteraceae bacterium AZCC 2146]